MKQLYRSFKILLLFLFCFIVGGALVIQPLREKGLAGVTFSDVYPGLAAMLAGFVLIGLLWFLARVPKEPIQNQPHDDSTVRHV